LEAPSFFVRDYTPILRAASKAGGGWGDSIEQWRARWTNSFWWALVPSPA
jgi:hypothetical protein